MGDSGLVQYQLYRSFQNETSHEVGMIPTTRTVLFNNVDKEYLVRWSHSMFDGTVLQTAIQIWKVKGEEMLLIKHFEQEDDVVDFSSSNHTLQASEFTPVFQFDGCRYLGDVAFGGYANAHQLVCGEQTYPFYILVYPTEYGGCRPLYANLTQSVDANVVLQEFDFPLWIDLNNPLAQPMAELLFEPYQELIQPFFH